MYSIGQRLRDERLRQGLKLSDVSEQTRIRSVFLEAIEADDFDALPGRFYARSFVRQYARLLGIQDPELEAEISRQLGEPGPVVTAEQVLATLSGTAPEKPPIMWRTRPDPRWLGYATIGLLVVAGILGVYLGWQRARARAEARQAAVAVELNKTEKQEPSTPGPAQPAMMPAQGAPAAPAIAPQSGNPALAPPAQARLTEAQPAAGAPLVAEVAARSAAWVQVSVDGKVVFVGNLQAGQRQTFRASERIRILTGNAGALEITRNGRPLGLLGPEGQVRTIELTPQGHTVSAPKPKPPAEETPPAEPSPPSETPSPLSLNPQ